MTFRQRNMRGRSLRAGLKAAGLALAMATGLGACSSSGENDFQQLGALTKVSIFGAEEKAPQPELTREQLNQIPSATIALSLRPPSPCPWATGRVPFWCRWPTMAAT
jgi:hypothetical protein